MSGDRDLLRLKTYAAITIARTHLNGLLFSPDICATVLTVSGNQIRLGVTAPKDVPVHREEVAERIRAEAIEAR